MVTKSNTYWARRQLMLIKTIMLTTVTNTSTVLINYTVFQHRCPHQNFMYRSMKNIDQMEITLKEEYRQKQYFNI